MPSSILTTKLYAPQPRSAIVQRPRLLERLNAGLRRRLTVIAAPAGFGKTTLISEWVQNCGRPSTWLSLDEGDSDLYRFLTYLIAALRAISAHVGAGVLPALQSSQPVPTETILTTLINDISAVKENFILVLDDYHMIDSQPVDDALTYLLEHLPPPMHLAITSREDPNLPLARLRVRDQLTELRAADLRFTPAEAAEFLNRVMGLALSAEDAAILENRTEGWVAGLQLAALSTQMHQDVSGFIREFAGDHRYIMDYLVEEVLAHQSQPVRGFLLQTAILDRLNGPLCEAVTGQQGGSAQLEALQRGNFFVIPLDDNRHWYRYHHLFAEVLRAYLMAEQPDAVDALHRRASQWYEQNNSPADAIHHALAGGDFEHAAGLVERIFAAMARSRQEATLLVWLKALPEALVRDHPVLCNLYAGTLLQTGKMEGVEAWLQAAERWLIPQGELPERSHGMVVVDPEEFRRLPGAVAMHRAGQALMLGKVDEAIRHARRVLELAPEDDYLRRGGAATLQGLVFWTTADLEAARRIYPEGMVWLQRAGHLSDSIGCALALADIVITQGHLQEAMGIYEQALRLAAERGEPKLRGTADMLVGISELNYEENDLHTAAQYLLRAREQGEHTGLPQSRYRWRVAMARIHQAQGDENGALDLLNEAERLYMGDFSPNVRPVAAVRAGMWAAQGRLDEALEWARARGLSAEDSPEYLREYEHITLARVMLARHRQEHAASLIHEAIRLLECLLKAAEDGGRTGSVIQILVLYALALQEMAQPGLDDPAAALAPLERALRLAEPEGYIRLFVDEGQPMEQLLRAAARQEILPGYTAKLLRAFREKQLTGAKGEEPSGVQARAVPAKLTQGTLVEPLSERELDVLRLFKTELSGPEIARELVIALSTVRTHTKTIYNKLGVNNRRASVTRAIELGLF